MAKEAKLQKKIIDYINKGGGYAVNIMSASTDGVPDILACIEGKFVGLEVKVGSNKPSDLQLANQELIEDAKGIAIIVWDLKTVQALVERLKKTPT